MMTFILTILGVDSVVGTAGIAGIPLVEVLDGAIHSTLIHGVEIVGTAGIVGITGTVGMTRGLVRLMAIRMASEVDFRIITALQVGVITTITILQ